VFISLSCAGLLGCQTYLEVRVLPGSRVDNVVFEISDEGRPDGINVEHVLVYRCSEVRNRPAKRFPETAIWEVGDPFAGGVTATGARFKYGVTPNGLISRTKALPLEFPGCYVVRASAIDKFGGRRIAPLAFEVRKDGSVRQMSLREHHALWEKRN
jgi:hypothetical protein